jgi:hypothetical protein
LEDLVLQYLPAVPRDPFDGQPLRMAAGPEGLLLYSVGKDGVDDGGDDPDGRGEPDVAIRLRRAKGSAEAVIDGRSDTSP